MDRTGMVHALEKVHGLLKPGGELIDIHPMFDPPAFEVRVGEKKFPVGWLRETDDYEEYELADEALAEVVKRGLFSIEHKGTFSFITHADTAAELKQYLIENWSDAIIDEIIFARAEEMFNSIERDKEMILRVSTNIMRLRRI
jgi:hypothetical protein